MSIPAYEAIWAHSTAKSGARLVLLAIADHANETGFAYPGIKRLATMTQMSVRQVKRCLRQLEDAGELRCVRGAGPYGCNAYYMLPQVFRPRVKRGTECHPAPLGGDVRDAEGVTPATREGDAHATQTVIEPSKEPNPSIPLSGEDEYWIIVAFKGCFNQSPRRIKPRLLWRLREALPDLDKAHAPALVQFYQAEPVGCKEPPFNSRKHSPERLLGDLPRQLANAASLYPPPKPVPPPPEGWQDARDALYPGLVPYVRGQPFDELPNDIQREIQAWLAKHPRAAAGVPPAPI